VEKARNGGDSSRTDFQYEEWLFSFLGVRTAFVITVCSAVGDGTWCRVPILSLPVRYIRLDVLAIRWDCVGIQRQVSPDLLTSMHQHFRVFCLWQSSL